MKHFLPVILILAGICVQSCIDCGPQAELSARIFFTGDSLKLDSVYALNAVSQEAIRLLPARSQKDRPTIVLRGGLCKREHAPIQ